MPKYKSKKFLELFKTFKRMFEEEGDVYNNLKKSLEEDYEHKMIPNNIEKKVIALILRDAAIDYYKNDIKILTEVEYLNKINNE